MLQNLPCFERQHPLSCCKDALCIILQLFGQVGQVGRCQLCRCRRGGCAQVCRIVTQGKIRFVPHRADERHGASGDPFDQLLVVKAPQVLHRAAASAQDDDIAVSLLLQRIQRLHHRLRRRLALHLCRTKDQRCQRAAPGKDVDDVPKGSTRGRGHHPDASGIGWDGLLILLRKQSLPVQLAVQLLKGDLQRSPAVRLHIIDIQLIASVPLVQRDRAAQNDRHAIFRLKQQVVCIAAEHDRPHRAVALLEGEITVPAALVTDKVGNFPTQQQIFEQGIAVEQAFDIAVELGNA